MVFAPDIILHRAVVSITGNNMQKSFLSTIDVKGELGKRRGDGVGRLFDAEDSGTIEIPCPSPLPVIPVRVPVSASSTQLFTVCKEQETSCSVSCPSDLWLHSEPRGGWRKKVGVRAWADRPVLGRTACHNMIQCDSHLLWEVELRPDTVRLSL